MSKQAPEATVSADKQAQMVLSKEQRNLMAVDLATLTTYEARRKHADTLEDMARAMHSHISEKEYAELHAAFQAADNAAEELRVPPRKLSKALQEEITNANTEAANAEAANAEAADAEAKVNAKMNENTPEGGNADQGSDPAEKKTESSDNSKAIRCKAPSYHPATTAMIATASATGATAIGLTAWHVVNHALAASSQLSLQTIAQGFTSLPSSQFAIAIYVLAAVAVAASIAAACVETTKRRGTGVFAERKSAPKKATTENPEENAESTESTEAGASLLAGS